MQKIVIGNSLLGDEFAIAQHLIYDILTCFGVDVLKRAPLAAEAPHRGASCCPYVSGKRCPIEAPHRGAPYRRTIGKFGALLKTSCPP